MCIRDSCYFELTTLWGNPPLVDRVLKNSEEYKVSKDVYKRQLHYDAKILIKIERETAGEHVLNKSANI